MRERIRLSYGSPTRNISGCVMVGVCFVSAGQTQELGLGFAVPLGDVTADRTFPAGVARINRHDGNSGALGLVLQEPAELAEAPVVQSFALLFVGPYPAADVRQIFERNPHAVAFGSRNDALGNAVVLMRLEPPLFAAHAAQSALGSLRVNALKDGPAFSVALAVGFYLGAAVLVAKAVRGDADDAKVYTKHPVRRKQARVVEVAHGGEIPLAAHEHQIDLALTVPHQLALMVSTSVGDLLTAGKNPQGNQIAGHEAQDAVIVGLRSMLAKLDRLNLIAFRQKRFGGLVGVGDLLDALNGNLCRQREAGANLDIERLVHVVLAEHLRLKSCAGKPVARLIATLQRGAKSAFLIWCRLQFQIGNEFHALKYREFCAIVNHKRSSLPAARYPSPS